MIVCMILAVILCAGCKEPMPSTVSTVHDHIDQDDNGRCDICRESVIVYIDFYSVNDLHGKLADADTHPGVDELSSYFKMMRSKDEYAILLSSGDMWQGSAESNMTKGQIITDWMNALDFAAMTIGNHEFDWGEEYIAQNAAIAEFPFLAINIYDRETNERVEYCQSSVIVDCGSLQVGIIGAIGDCYSSISADKAGDVYFKTGGELTALVKAESQKLRDSGVDFVVYLLHDGHGNSTDGTVSSGAIRSYYDTSLSDGYVDLVFEGHSHQRYVFVDEFGVYHLQGGGDNKGITHAEIGINELTGSFVVTQREYVYASSYQTYPDDDIVQDLLNKYEDFISGVHDVIGMNSYSRNRDQMRQLVADLYFRAGLEKWGLEYDIVLGGGFMSIRSPGYLPKGEVTYAMLQSLFPFDNELVLCSIKGSDLLAKFIHSNNDNYFICRADARDIDPDGTYYIVVDSYTSTYAPNRLTEIARYGENIFARDLLAEYIAMGGLE